MEHTALFNRPSRSHGRSAYAFERIAPAIPRAALGQVLLDLRATQPRPRCSCLNVGLIRPPLVFTGRLRRKYCRPTKSLASPRAKPKASSCQELRGGRHKHRRCRSCRASPGARTGACPRFGHHREIGVVVVRDHLDLGGDRLGRGHVRTGRCLRSRARSRLVTTDTAVISWRNRRRLDDPARLLMLFE